MIGGLALSRPVPAAPAPRTPAARSARAGGVQARRSYLLFEALVREADRAREAGARWGLDTYLPEPSTT